MAATCSMGKCHHSNGSAPVSPQQCHHPSHSPGLSLYLHKALGQVKSKSWHCQRNLGSVEERDSPVPSCATLSCPLLPHPVPSHPHSTGCSTALPRCLACKLFPQGPTENNKRTVSFPDGIYFNLYITCNFGLIPYFISSLTVFFFCINYHSCEEIMLL